uniref:Inner membrane protein n=1 Tax=Heterorhabditis bacteriophora TaxID=37862 RepID=A0A1I7WYH0_HETBA
MEEKRKVSSIKRFYEIQQASIISLLFEWIITTTGMVTNLRCSFLLGYLFLAVFLLYLFSTHRTLRRQKSAVELCGFEEKCAFDISDTPLTIQDAVPEEYEHINHTYYYNVILELLFPIFKETANGTTIK